MRLSIIVPVLDEAARMSALATSLQPLARAGVEILVVDGGSRDDTVALAEQAGFTVLRADAGRARQMNAGATASHGDVLLFLHADTTLPERTDRLVIEALEHSKRVWGRFDVRIDGRPRMLRMVAFMMNLRSRVSGIATGDQAIFVTRTAFDAVGGFPDQPLMEDIELSRRLRRICRPICLRKTVLTSGRRWEARGVWRTIALMWRLRWAYWRGTPTDELARRYR